MYTESVWSSARDEMLPELGCLQTQIYWVLIELNQSLFFAIQTLTAQDNETGPPWHHLDELT